MAAVAEEIKGYTVNLTVDELNLYVINGLRGAGVTLPNGAQLFWPDGDTAADTWSWTLNNGQKFGPGTTLSLKVQDGEVPA